MTLSRQFVLFLIPAWLVTVVVLGSLIVSYGLSRAESLLEDTELELLQESANDLQLGFDEIPRQREPDVHHHHQADHFRRRLEVPERVGFHPTSLRGEICGQQADSPDNALSDSRIKWAESPTRHRLKSSAWR